MRPLGQVAKRLQIIKTAITMTDDEAINMQRSKLRLHKGDDALETILDVLDNENYAQASKLIEEYLHAASEDKNSIAQDPPEEYMDTRIKSEQEEELIKKFGLFMDKANKQPYIPTDEEEKEKVSKSPEESSASPSAPNKPTTDDIMAQFNAIKDEDIPEDNKIESAQIKHAKLLTRGNRSKKTKIVTHNKPKVSAQASSDKEAKIDETRVPKALQSPEIPIDTTPLTYPPIPYIDQKFNNMRSKYPQTEESTEEFKSVEKLISMIKLERYSEADIEETIDYIFSLKKSGKLAEAAQLLLVCGATESLYAQFVLSRELYSGELLKRDISESFTQINRLAIDKYPEALCDLAQFYEHGIGTEMNKKKAISLYEDAKRLGIERANTHLDRIEQNSKGILGSLFKK